MLAAILAEAPRLESLRIFPQKGTRHIEVDLQLAKARSPTSNKTKATTERSGRFSERIRDRGYVRIFNPITNQTICQVNSWQTT